MCQQHGGQIGILACNHVRTAVEKAHAPLEFRKVRQDFFGEDMFRGTTNMRYLSQLLCLECIHAFGIDPEKVFPFIEDEKEAQKKFPYVAPMCPLCLAEYQKAHPATLSK
jgi:hypothetical protein